MSNNRLTRAQLKKKDKNNCVCHFCRKSENRKRIGKVRFNPCSLCNKTYCEQCTIENPKIRPDIYGCLYCQGQCCCQKKCKQNHKCCFNSRRSHKRRDQKNSFSVIESLSQERENPMKRKYDQIEGTTLYKFIDYLGPEFYLLNPTPHIYKPIPLRVYNRFV